MILKKEETERFYRIWWALLRYTNAREKVIADLPEAAEEQAIPMEAAFKTCCISDG